MKPLFFLFFWTWSRLHKTFVVGKTLSKLFLRALLPPLRHVQFRQCVLISRNCDTLWLKCTFPTADLTCLFVALNIRSQTEISVLSKIDMQPYLLSLHISNQLMIICIACKILQAIRLDKTIMYISRRILVHAFEGHMIYYHTDFDWSIMESINCRCARSVCIVATGEAESRWITQENGQVQHSKNKERLVDFCFQQTSILNYLKIFICLDLGCSTTKCLPYHFNIPHRGTRPQCL